MNRRQFCGNSLAAAIAASLPTGAASGAALRALTEVTSSISGVTGMGEEVVLRAAELQELKESLGGNLLLSGSEGYEKARRVLNRAIDKRPALIVQPSGAADVANAVSFAREHDLLLAVKCGGHSFSGKSTCDGGLQIDLSTLRHVRVDSDRRTAYVAGGSLLGDVDHESMAYGLVTPTGTVSHTGVGGLTLGGGFGRLGRRFGLTLDNVKAFDVVTADGKLRRASAAEHRDLYWGLRGGGGNFGVVTSFEFDLQPISRTVVGGDMVFPLDRAREVLQLYAEFSQSAPEDLYLDLVMVAPPGGEPGVVLIHACYSGEQKDSRLDKLGKPLANSIAAVDYVALQRTWDDSDPRQGGDYLKSGFVTDISRDLIDALTGGFEPHPERATTFYFQQGGGEINRVPADATAFPHRHTVNGPGAVIFWNPGVDPAPHIQYVREYWADLEKFMDGYYFNASDDESQPSTQRNYRGNFDRLLGLKNKYDPTNLFRLNANIKPTGRV